MHSYTVRHVVFARAALIALLTLYVLSPIQSYADETPSTLETELETMLKRIIETCKASSDPDACTLEKIGKKRALYESFLERTTPEAWPNADIISFVYFHVAQQIAKEQVRCNALGGSGKQSCVEQISTLIPDARDEARHLLIDKGAAYGQRQAAERNARDRQLHQEYANAQHEHEMERARLQALGMFLGGGGFMQPLPPLPAQPTYQPPPPQPTYQPAPFRALPPVSCSSQTVGQMQYTDCY